MQAFQDVSSTLMSAPAHAHHDSNGRAAVVHLVTHFLWTAESAECVLCSIASYIYDWPSARGSSVQFWPQFSSRQFSWVLGFDRSSL